MHNNFIDEFYTLQTTRDGARGKVKTDEGHIYYLRPATEQDILDSFVHGTPLWKRNHGQTKPHDAISVPDEVHPPVFDDRPDPWRYSMVQIYCVDYPAQPVTGAE